MVFAFLKALSVTYSASASRESFESRQGHAPEQETTETQSFESMSPHATGLIATSAHAATGVTFLGAGWSWSQFILSDPRIPAGSPNEPRCLVTDVFDRGE